MIEDVIEAWKGKPIREILIECYIDNDMSMSQVAKELHISVGKVHTMLNKYEIYKNKDIFNKKG